jgi:hypothetical protein
VPISKVNKLENKNRKTKILNIIIISWVIYSD